MLSPEVWNFKAPESNFSAQKYSFHGADHLKVVNNFVYNHLVSVFLPDTVKVPESLTEALNECDYYRINNLKFSDILAKDFLDNFVHSGSLYVLSVGTRIDCDNCAAVTPSGQLILSLNKTLYQTLGLEGAASHFHAVTKDRYIVTVDLKAKHFKPAKPNYEKTKACLQKICLDVIVTWEPPTKDVCPSSVAKYFHDLGYGTRLCTIKQKSHVVYSVKVPEIQDDQHSEFVEWLGMVALEGNMTDGAPDNYLTTYQTPEPYEYVGQVRYMQWRGFFTAAQITRFHKQLQEFMINTNMEWSAMYVQGFSDSVIAWNGEENHFYTNGDNSYTFILTKDHIISFIQKCSRKRYSNKRKGKPL